MKLLKLLLIGILMQVLILTGCSSKGKPAAPANSAQPQQQVQDEEVKAEDMIAKGKEIKSMYFEYEVTAATEAGTMNVKCWVKGENVRTEMAGIEGQGSVITIVNSAKGIAYMYMPEQNTATKIDISQAIKDTESPEDTLKELNPADMNYLGQETIDGKECLVYEIAIPEGSSKTWIWEDYGIPVRYETVINNEKSVIEYKNLKVEDIDDSMFELPANVQVMDFELPAAN